MNGLNDKNITPKAVYLLYCMDSLLNVSSVVCAYSSLEKAERATEALREKGFQVWFDEVEVDASLVTHTATCDAQPVLLRGEADVVVESRGPITLGQARQIASRVDAGGRSVIGYGFGPDQAVAHLLSRIRVSSPVAMLVAA